jgi:hypothetical protein
LTERINEDSYFLHNGRAQLGGNSIMAGAEALPARQRLSVCQPESAKRLSDFWNRFLSQPTKHNKMFETQHYLLSDSTKITNINQRHSCHINKWRAICIEAISVIYLHI